MIEILLGISLILNVVLFMRLRVASIMKKNMDSVVDYLMREVVEK